MVDALSFNVALSFKIVTCFGKENNVRKFPATGFKKWQILIIFQFFDAVSAAVLPASAPLCIWLARIDEYRSTDSWEFHMR